MASTSLSPVQPPPEGGEGGGDGAASEVGEGVVDVSSAAAVVEVDVGEGV